VKDFKIINLVYPEEMLNPEEILNRVQNDTFRVQHDILSA